MFAVSCEVAVVPRTFSCKLSVGKEYSFDFTIELANRSCLNCASYFLKSESEIRGSNKSSSNKSLASMPNA